MNRVAKKKMADVQKIIDMLFESRIEEIKGYLKSLQPLQLGDNEIKDQLHKDIDFVVYCLDSIKRGSWFNDLLRDLILKYYSHFEEAFKDEGFNITKEVK